jgi:hypothetical protein
MINRVIEYKNAKGQARKWILLQFVISGLRRMSYKIPSRSIALTRARVKRGVYKCEMCGKEIKKSQMAVDHKLPIVPVTGWDTFDGFIDRLFCNPEDLQVICKEPCHAEKTKNENTQRRKYAKDHNKK